MAFVTCGAAVSGRYARAAAVSRAAARASSARSAGVRMAFSSIEGVLTEPRAAAPSAMGFVSESGRPEMSPLELNDLVAAIYKQVFGNAHIMESERETMATAESTFRLNRSVPDFVRALAKSDAYVSRFLHGNSQYRFFELNFKHLLGRGPRSQAEIATHFALYYAGGFEAVIDAIIDSEEFNTEFGICLAPFCRFKGEYPTNEEFNRMLVLMGAPSTSDKAARGRSKLCYSIASGGSQNWLSMAKALPAGTERGTGFQLVSSTRNPNARTRVATRIPGGIIVY
mmetsp:Transcript_3065/g.8472  ORF Transcript_3065/g.8472 Transcript_3065/m.8472 type:complete len:284 (-) Transcript_3065:141-992(-)|eukprot:CAMPEP_0185830342 /NCGR_PEP_ID=MMETSP1353-20130828/782_1 /TAXON_ID=1077150 /ORGANISM="Erythrolobus australicus, Strain CCMP3124" /LENGTH=283 /DNA_ID=CAMNT_0028528231 /DNA_START=55 /DNA_END=906 /DNA_ORIENTATION=-